MSNSRAQAKRKSTKHRIAQVDNEDKSSNYARLDGSNFSHKLQEVNVEESWLSVKSWVIVVIE